MTVKVRAQLAETEHRIIGWNPIRGGSPQKPNYEGQFVAYGDTAILEAEGFLFNSVWDLDEDEEPVYALSFQVVIVKDAQAEEAEDIDIDEPDVEAAIAEIEGDDGEEEDEEEDEGHDA